MTPTELDALTADVEARGQRHAIIVYEGQVLDGWHRYQACQRLGLEPLTQPFTGDDAAARALVLTTNLHRRHLTASQRAVAVVAVAQWKPQGSNQFSGGSAPSAEALAEQADVSERTVRHAKEAVRAGRADEVKAGKASVRRVADEERAKRALAKPAREEAEESEEPPDDRLGDLVVEYEALTRIVEADDKLAAAWAEVKLEQERHAQTKRLYEAQRAELAEMTREAKRWMRKAQALEKAAKP
jgi:ParB-like chromosome segregation protein Spo0J